MPHNYDKVLTPEEYQDLVAMLARQVRTTLHVQSRTARGRGGAMKKILAFLSWAHRAHLPKSPTSICSSRPAMTG
jgi:hypothetical protein